MLAWEAIEKCMNGNISGIDYLNDEGLEHIKNPSTNSLTIFNFLNANSCNTEAKEFAKDAIEAELHNGEVDYGEKVILDSTFVNNQNAKCIYDKLLASPKFKNLITDTFGGDEENLNITYKVSDTISVNGRCVPGKVFIDPDTGKITSANMEVLIRKSNLTSDSAMSIARTILHESIHAYLMVKQYGCNQGTPFKELGDIELAELLNEYFSECATLQGQHEFMFNFMIPTMSEILADIKDDLIPSHHQAAAEEKMFINEENPITDSLGEDVTNVPWNWGTFYKYLSMAGLHNSSAFHFEIGDRENNQSPEYKNFERYAIITGTRSFKKGCND